MGCAHAALSRLLQLIGSIEKGCRTLVQMPRCDWLQLGKPCIFKIKWAALAFRNLILSLSVS